MRRLLACGALAALLGAAVGGAATDITPRTAYPGTESWADAQNGWAWNVAAPRVGALCAKAWPHDVYGRRVCATDDGGRTWRTVLVTGRALGEQIVRTSADAGIVKTNDFGLAEEV